MGRAERITEYVKQHDYKLFCDKDHRTGTYCIFRKTIKFETYDVDGTTISFALPDRHMVTALTDNWNINGVPVDWGLLPIMDRIRRIDLWNNEVMVQKMISEYEKADEDKRKTRMDKHEDQAEMFRHDFKKSFGDHIVGNLIDKDKEKKRNERI